ncbi:resolvase, N terminal domain protein [Mycobacterium kansasii 824]|nr:resolvase, N terminal domain protein [Mycobacterium kansasii 824]
MRLCKQRKWTPIEYVDNDVGASNGKRRPAYEKMLADITDGQIGAVVAWDLDRLHRRPIELERFMDLADTRKLALATVSGDVDLSTAQGRLTARLKGAVAATKSSTSQIGSVAPAARPPRWGGPGGNTRSATWQAPTGLSPTRPRPRWSSRLTPRFWPVRRSATSAKNGTPPGCAPSTASDGPSRSCRISYASPATPGCALTRPTRTAPPKTTLSAKAAGRRWWMRRRFGLLKLCWTRPAARPGARVCAATS